MVKAFQESPDLIISFINCWSEIVELYSSWKMQTFLDFLFTNLRRRRSSDSTIIAIENLLHEMESLYHHSKTMSLYRIPVCRNSNFACLRVFCRLQSSSSIVSEKP